MQKNTKIHPKTRKKAPKSSQKHKKQQKKNIHIIKRIKKTSEDILITKKLSFEYKKLLQKAVQDLTNNSESSSKIKFNLKSNVVAEIETVADSDLPRYLVHRYRYEIFPQTKILRLGNMVALLICF